MVTSVSASAAQSSLTQAAPAAAQGTSLSTDFETFLKMLTAQARYQDPMEPLDSAEYASQLAQFSSVEQSVRTNELLEQIALQSGVTDLSGAAMWIGKEVMTQVPQEFLGDPLTIYTDVPNDGATSADMVVYDTTGVEIQRIEIDPEGDTLYWAGVSSTGDAFENGQYEIEVQRFSGEVLLSAEPVSSYSKVTEVRMIHGQPELQLAHGNAVFADAVIAVR